MILKKEKKATFFAADDSSLVESSTASADLLFVVVVFAFVALGFASGIGAAGKAAIRPDRLGSVAASSEVLRGGMTERKEELQLYELDFTVQSVN